MENIKKEIIDYENEIDNLKIINNNLNNKISDLNNDLNNIKAPYEKKIKNIIIKQINVKNDLEEKLMLQEKSIDELNNKISTLLLANKLLNNNIEENNNDIELLNDKIIKQHKLITFTEDKLQIEKINQSEIIVNVNTK